MRTLMIVLSLVFAASALAEPYKPDAGPVAFSDETDVWYDGMRDREIPVRVYLPEGEGPFPTVIFSHAVAGDRDESSFLGRHWASHGYIGVFVQHPGSDRDAEQRRSAGKRLPIDRGDQRLKRFEDMRFAIDEAARRHPVDLDRVAAAGQSPGAIGAMVMVGTRFATATDAEARDLGDERFRAAICISPAGTNVDGFLRTSWETVRAPVLWLTGTDDRDPVTHAPAFRREAFDLCSGPDQYLVTLEGAEHQAFNDRQIRRGMRERLPGQHDDVRSVTTAFLDAYLLDDENAEAWLASDQPVEASLSGLAIERKN